MAAQRMGLAEQGDLYSDMLGRKGGLKPGNPATNNKNIVFRHESSLAPDTIAEMVREEQIQPPAGCTMRWSPALSSLRSAGFQSAWRPGWPPSQEPSDTCCGVAPSRVGRRSLTLSPPEPLGAGPTSADWHGYNLS